MTDLKATHLHPPQEENLHREDKPEIENTIPFDKKHGRQLSSAFFESPNKQARMITNDLNHILQLQKDLWRWPKSRSAVMVGAGFSLNSKPLPGVTSSFPTWNRLVRKMFDKLWFSHAEFLKPR